MSEGDSEDKSPAGAMGPPDTKAVDLPQLVLNLSALEKTQLLQLLQGAKPKVVKPEAALGATGPPPNPDNSNSADNRDDNAAGALNNPIRIDENKIPRIPSFSGVSSKSQPSFRVWEFEIENLKSTFSEREIKRAIHRSVTGMAAEALMRLGNDVTVSQILAKFKLIFGTVVNNEQLFCDFYTAVQKPSESIAEWACRLEDSLCHPQLDSISSATKNSMLKSKFFQGLSQEQLKQAIRHKLDSSSYDELLVSARQAEEEHRLKSKVVSKPQIVDSTQTKLEEIQSTLKSLSTKVDQLDRKVNSSRKQPGRSASIQSQDSTGPSVERSSSFTCYYCKQPGHIKRNCVKLLNLKSSAVGSNK